MVDYDQMSLDELDRVLASERYRYFLRRVAESGEIWMLQYSDGSFVSLDDQDGRQYFVYWPGHKIAAKHALDDWSDAMPVAVGLAEFLEQGIQILELERLGVIVFPTTEGVGVRIEAEKLHRLAHDLQRWSDKTTQ